MDSWSNIGDNARRRQANHISNLNFNKHDDGSTGRRQPESSVRSADAGPLRFSSFSWNDRQSKPRSDVPIDYAGPTTNSDDNAYRPALHFLGEPGQIEGSTTTRSSPGTDFLQQTDSVTKANSRIGCFSFFWSFHHSNVLFLQRTFCTYQAHSLVRISASQ